jgi:hypothetical protein
MQVCARLRPCADAFESEISLKEVAAQVAKTAVNTPS